MQTTSLLNKPEVLAPAGDMERLTMALAYGADAVYLAGVDFGMRAFAGNFDRDGLKTAIALCRAHGVKVYVTCNTMARNDEVARQPEFLEYLERLVANVAHGGVLLCQYETVALTFVAPAEHGYIRLVFQQMNEVFHMGCLACAADGDIANGDDGHLIGVALQDAHLEEHIPESHSQAVEPTQRPQFLVNIDKVTFHPSSFTLTYFTLTSSSIRAWI